MSSSLCFLDSNGVVLPATIVVNHFTQTREAGVHPADPARSQRWHCSPVDKFRIAAMHIFIGVQNVDVMRTTALNAPPLVLEVRVNKPLQRWLVKRNIDVLVTVNRSTVQADQIEQVRIANQG